MCLQKIHTFLTCSAAALTQAIAETENTSDESQNIKKLLLSNLIFTHSKKHPKDGREGIQS